MSCHPAVVVREVIRHGSVAEDLHEEEAVWSEPGGYPSEQHLVVLHVFEHLLDARMRGARPTASIGTAHFDGDDAIESV